MIVQEFLVFIGEIAVRLRDSIVLMTQFTTFHLSKIDFGFAVLIFIIALFLFFRIPIIRSLLLIPYLIVRFFLKILGLIAPVEEWSVVYDSKSKHPLDPVYVSIKDMLGQEVASAVTDLDGRFGLLVPPGTYTIEVQKTNYVFPSKRLAGKKKDGYRNQLYFGERLTIVDDERVLALHIPMDPIAKDWNQAEKKRRQLFGIFREKKIEHEGTLFYLFVGTLLTLAHHSVSRTDDTRTLLMLFATLSALMIIASIIRATQKHHSVVLERATGAPVAFARVRFFTEHKKFEVAKRITSRSGQFVCLLPPGAYYLTIEKRGLDGTYELAYTSHGFYIRNGYVHKKIKI
jgi:hypothetical protein